MKNLITKGTKVVRNTSKPSDEDYSMACDITLDSTLNFAAKVFDQADIKKQFQIDPDPDLSQGLSVLHRAPNNEFKYFPQMPLILVKIVSYLDVPRAVQVIRNLDGNYTEILNTEAELQTPPGDYHDDILFYVGQVLPAVQVGGKWFPMFSSVGNSVEKISDEKTNILVEIDVDAQGKIVDFFAAKDDSEYVELGHYSALIGQTDTGAQDIQGTASNYDIIFHHVATGKFPLYLKHNFTSQNWIVQFWDNYNATTKKHSDFFLEYRINESGLLLSTNTNTVKTLGFAGTGVINKMKNYLAGTHPYHNNEINYPKLKYGKYIEENSTGNRIAKEYHILPRKIASYPVWPVVVFSSGTYKYYDPGSDTESNTVSTGRNYYVLNALSAERGFNDEADNYIMYISNSTTAQNAIVPGTRDLPTANIITRLGKYYTKKAFFRTGHNFTGGGMYCSRKKSDWWFYDFSNLYGFGKTWVSLTLTPLGGISSSGNAFICYDDWNGISRYSVTSGFNVLELI